MLPITKALIFLAITGVIHAGPVKSKRDILTPLPQNASEDELRYQPWLDFDKDS
jgi:hypothetical protein